MSRGSDDAPTGPIRGQAAPVTGDPPRRRTLVRDVTAGVLLVLALLLPWNLYFGVGIPGSRTALFAVLGLVTLLSLLSLALTRLRVPLNVPYQLLVIAFVVFDVVQTIRSGGGVHVPGGVGPGAWLGIAGSLLAALDLAAGVLAIWLRVNLANASVSRRLTTSLCGLLCALGISRVVVGVVLAPRFQEIPNGGGWANPVYGNDLAQQITSTFDVALCWLALSILAAAVISGRRSPITAKRRAAHTRTARPPVPVAPSAAATTRIPTRPPGDAPTTVLSVPAGSPRIFRGDDSATRQIRIPPAPKPRIYRPPHHPS